jgi:hypothetical protein
MSKLSSSLRVTRFWKDFSERNVMFEVFFAWQDIVHHRFIPKGVLMQQGKVKGCAVLSKFYLKHPMTRCIFMTVPQHISHCLCSKHFTKHGTVVLPYPSHSHTMQFVLLSAYEESAERHHFKNVAEVHLALKIALQEIASHPLQKCFRCLYEY